MDSTRKPVCEVAVSIASDALQNAGESSDEAIAVLTMAIQIVRIQASRDHIALAPAASRGSQDTPVRPGFHESL
jgi:hypothetical protein